MQFNKQLAITLGAACLLLVAALSYRNLNSGTQVINTEASAEKPESIATSWPQLIASGTTLEELPELIQKQLAEGAKVASQEDLSNWEESIIICEKNGYYLPATLLKLRKAQFTKTASDWKKAGEAIYALGATSADSLQRVFLMNEVVIAMDKALNQSDTLLTAKLYKGMALADDRNKIMMAVPLLKEVEEADPDNLLAVYTLGLLSIESRQLDKALQRFEKLVSLQPSNAEYHFQLGQIWKLKGEEARALQEFEQSLKLTKDPNTKGYIENIIKNLQ